MNYYSFPFWDLYFVLAAQFTWWSIVYPGHLFANRNEHLLRLCVVIGSTLCSATILCLFLEVRNDSLHSWAIWIFCCVHSETESKREREKERTRETEGEGERDIVAYFIYFKLRVRCVKYIRQYIWFPHSSAFESRYITFKRHTLPSHCVNN